MTPDEVRQTVFPDLAAADAPRSPRAFALLLGSPTFQERIATLNLRYVVFVSGDKEASLEYYAAGGGYPPGCVLLILNFRQARLAAAVFDIKDARMARVGTADASAEGVGWMLLPIPPVGVPAFTDTRACTDLGEALAPFFSGEKPATPRERTP